MEPETIEIACADGFLIRGHWWRTQEPETTGTVVINCATGVPARYYHRYAAFLAAHGFNALTYDYRGIGLSRPDRLSRLVADWRHWGDHDFAAALSYAKARATTYPLAVVGHSIGGFLPGYAEGASAIDRMLTVGAQYGHWRDYAAARKLGMTFKWHVAMPAITALWGYFLGSRLGWLEDLPAGVVFDWGLGRRRIEDRLGPWERQSILRRFASVGAPILAVSVSDDPFATMPAMDRSLSYFSGAKATKVMLHPADLDAEAIGHFDLFHDRHAAGFWLDTLLWLRDGINPWPGRVFS